MSNQGWKLREASQSGLVPRSAIYQGAIHDEALARLLFIIEQHRHCGLLFGLPGAGKSLLLQQLSRIVRRSAREVAFVDLHGRDLRETLWELCGELGLNPKFNDKSFGLWCRIQDHFLAGIGALLPSVVILDHADQGLDETSELVERLAHLARQRRGLTLILSVRANSLADLSETLRDATDLRIELGWLDVPQTFEFVDAVFQLDEQTPQFEESAIRRMHALSEGSPRLLAQLGDLAILSALANEDAAISEQTVLTAAHDLQISGTPKRRTPVASSTRPFYD